MHLAQYFSIAGLAIDLAGALLIGYEVFNRFRGEMVQRKGGIEYTDVDIPAVTETFKQWEAQKHRVMALGLGCLTLGFVLQIIGVYIQR